MRLMYSGGTHVHSCTATADKTGSDQSDVEHHCIMIPISAARLKEEPKNPQHQSNTPCEQQIESTGKTAKKPTQKAKINWPKSNNRGKNFKQKLLTSSTTP